MQRGIPHKHIALFDDGEWLTPKAIINGIEKYKGDFTGHIPYHDAVDSYLRDKHIRNVFIYRDLRDVALSLAEYVKTGRHSKSEFNIVLENGKRLSDQDDVLLSAIYLVGEWWPKFEPWLTKADSVYTFAELRGAALLYGREGESSTFRAGQKGAWRYKFKPHHKKAAAEVLS
jgi:hypothetical protein